MNLFDSLADVELWQEPLGSGARLSLHQDKNE
jgi:hypothetical protein